MVSGKRRFSTFLFSVFFSLNIFAGNLHQLFHSEEFSSPEKHSESSTHYCSKLSNLHCSFSLILHHQHFDTAASVAVPERFFLKDRTNFQALQFSIFVKENQIISLRGPPLFS